MGITYEIDVDAAVHADDIANRIDTSAAYKGQFKKAWAIVADTGTLGIQFQFHSPDQGDAEFALYTERDDGTKIFGANILNAILYLLNIKKLESVPGLVEVYDKDKKARVEVEGETFPQLCNKDIGAILQKDITSRRNGSDSFRMNLYGVFDVKTQLTMTELKEGKTQPVKLKRILRGLKDKDSRKAKSAEASYGVSDAVPGDGY